MIAAATRERIWKIGAVVQLVCFLAIGAYGLRGSVRETLTFWTESKIPLKPEGPNALHTPAMMGVALAAAIWAVWSFLEGEGTRGVGSLAFAAGALDLYSRVGSRGGPTVFFFAMWAGMVAASVMRLRKSQPEGRRPESPGR